MSGRYETQMALPEIGPAGQARLAAARVLVVGAGGLGAPVLHYLAGAGVGRLTLIDPDRVEARNLHRQTLYRERDCGRPKALAAADALRGLNGEVAISAHAGAFDPANAPGLIADADVVIDAADSFAATYTLSDCCREAGKPLISASVIGMQGYAGGFCGSAPSYRAVFPQVPGSVANCAGSGVIGPAVGVLGALQAQMALSVLLGLSPGPLGTIVSADLAAFSFSSFCFLGAAEPDRYFPFVAAAALSEGDQVLDLRPSGPAPQPSWPGARRVGFEELQDIALDVSRRVVLCCRSGVRAWRAAEILNQRGYDHLALLAAGV